jgi:hypothetical protein
MENTKYQYYRFEEKHIKDAQFIFWKSFKYKVSEEFIKNKYNTSHIDVASICTIAFDKQKPIAFYGAIPQEFTNTKQSLLVAHTCDSYTLPQYQKQGLHYNLAKSSYDIMVKYDIKMAYAYHSDNTYYSTKRLNWKNHQNLNRFHIKINNLPVSKVLNKLGFNNLILSKAKQIFEPFLISTYPNPFSKTDLFHQNYNQEFYNYKDSFNPHFLIQLNNCTFYLKINSIVNVGYFDFDTEENLKTAVTSLKELTAKIGLNEILFQTDKNSTQFSVLEKFETPLPSWLIGYIPFEEYLNLNSFGFNFADLDTF